MNVVAEETSNKGTAKLTKYSQILVEPKDAELKYWLIMNGYCNIPMSNIWEKFDDIDHKDWNQILLQIGL